MTLPAVGRPDVEVLQPDPEPAQEGGEGAKPQGVADHRPSSATATVSLHDQRSGPNRTSARSSSVHTHLIREASRIGQLPDHGQSSGRSPSAAGRITRVAGPVRRGDHGSERGVEDRRVPAHAPPGRAVGTGALDVGHRRRAGTLGEGVLRVVLHLEHDTELRLRTARPGRRWARCPRPTPSGAGRRRGAAP